MNEAETRTEHIDPALKAAGWGVVQAENYEGKLAVRFAGFQKYLCADDVA